MARFNRKPSPAIARSKYIKRVVSGKLQDTWDMTKRYFLIGLPGGIVHADMRFQGIDRIHLLRFSAFECAGYQVIWDEADYPIDCEDYLIEREFRKLKRHCPDPASLPFPHMHAFTDFYIPACPAHFVGGRVPLRLSTTCRSSSSERRVCFPFCRACDRTRGPHMVSYTCINRGPVCPTHGGPLPTLHSPRHHRPSPLPAHHPTSTSSYVGSPLPSPVPLACVFLVNLASLSGNVMTLLSQFFAGTPTCNYCC